MEDLTLNASTISRLLDPFLINENFCFPYSDSEEDYADPHNLGFSLYCVTKSGKEWVPYDPEEHKGCSKYYYCENVFSDAELRTLIDAIEILFLFRE